MLDTNFPIRHEVQGLSRRSDRCLRVTPRTMFGKMYPHSSRSGKLINLVGTDLSEIQTESACRLGSCRSEPAESCRRETIANNRNTRAIHKYWISSILDNCCQTKMPHAANWSSQASATGKPILHRLDFRWFVESGAMITILAVEGMKRPIPITNEIFTLKFDVNASVTAYGVREKINADFHLDTLK
ncbi:unnamed protein product, partial [Nesidiocoris tenuis]